jgi:molecular chaperone GrpE
VKKNRKDLFEEQVRSSAPQAEDHQDPAVGAASEEYAPENINLGEKLNEKEKECAVNYDKYLRAVAELDNYKKRTAREKTDIIKYGKEDVIRDMLPFVDSLDRALEHAESNTDIQAFKEGLKLIQDQLLCSLKKHGVERIECTGKEFDPNFHEAMLQADSEHHEENKVIGEFERGYLLNGRLLRPSKVSVCKKIKKENNGCDQIAKNEE